MTPYVVGTLFPFLECSPITYRNLCIYLLELFVLWVTVSILLCLVKYSRLIDHLL
ncbi:hypothetical protein BDZ97DRAFT_1891064, partial [Flammula alnicola]